VPSLQLMVCGLATSFEASSVQNQVEKHLLKLHHVSFDLREAGDNVGPQSRNRAGKAPLSQL
jgi:hypothetical protein